MDRSERVGALTALGTATLVAGAGARLLAPRPLPPREPALAPTELFSPAEIRAGRRYARPQRRIGLASSAVELALLVRLVRRARATGTDADRPVDPDARAEAPPRGEALRAALAGAGLTAGLAVAGLPFAALARRRSVAVGLSTDTWSAWANDLVRLTLIESVLAGAGAGLSSVGARRLGERWWRGASAAMVVVGAGAGLLVPVLLEPVFNDFTELPPGSTRDDVLELAARAGVTVRGVFTMDASRRSTAVNAYVSGWGPTRRVVLFDTLLDRATREEIRFVVAHELGHVRHHDVGRMLGFLALTTPAVSVAIQRLATAWAGRMSAPAAVPALWLAAGVTLAPTGLASSWLSRAVERRTDAFALGLGGDPAALESFFRRIAVDQRADVTGGRLRTLLASHPPIVERVAAARAHAAGY